MKIRSRKLVEQGGREGFALLYSVITSFVVGSMVVVMFTAAESSKKVSDVTVAKTRARFIARGALSSVEEELRTTLANFDAPVLSGSKIVDGQTVSYEVSEVGQSSTLIEKTGIQRIVQPYEITARINTGDAVGTASRIINAEYTPLFQFAVFYDNDLEILPGPSMTLTGRVHSNGDLFLGSGGTLTFNSNHVRVLGEIFRSRKIGGPTRGNVDFRKYVANPFDASEPIQYERMLSASQLGPSSVSGYDSAFNLGYDSNGDGDFSDNGDYLPFEFGSQALWSQPDGYGTAGNTVRTGDHGVTYVSTPSVNSIQTWIDPGDGSGTLEKGYYHDNADLAILVDENGLTFTAIMSDGTDVTGLVAPAVEISDIYDARQSRSSSNRSTVLEVDMGMLTGLGLLSSEGLIYAAHEGLGEGLDASGVVLKNGSSLEGDVTVVSEGPVYIQGDYNTVNKKAAAVIADAVNLLSNSWDNSKEKGVLPRASETDYNVAIVTGSYESEVGRYNGGFENLPRFHENWSGIDCNILGSFVNSYDSVHATGSIGGVSNLYRPPGRKWSYDPDFNTVGNLPPYTPMAVTINSVVSW